MRPALEAPRAAPPTCGRGWALPRCGAATRAAASLSARAAVRRSAVAPPRAHVQEARAAQRFLRTPGHCAAAVQQPMPLQTPMLSALPEASVVAACAQGPPRLPAADGIGSALLAEELEEAAASTSQGSPAASIAHEVGSHSCLVVNSPRLTLSRNEDLPDGLVSLSSMQLDPLPEEVTEPGLRRRM